MLDIYENNIDRNELIEKIEKLYGHKAKETQFMRDICRVYPNKKKLNIHIAAVAERLVNAYYEREYKNILKSLEDK